MPGRGEVVDLRATRNHVDLRAAHKFTGHWPPDKPHTAVPSVNCVGISRKLKSTIQDQNNVSTSFISIIYDNLY